MSEYTYFHQIGSLIPFMCSYTEVDGKRHSITLWDTSEYECLKNNKHLHALEVDGIKHQEIDEYRCQDSSVGRAGD